MKNVLNFLAFSSLLLLFSPFADAQSFNPSRYDAYTVEVIEFERSGDRNSNLGEYSEEWTIYFSGRNPMNSSRNGFDHSGLKDISGNWDYQQWEAICPKGQGKASASSISRGSYTQEKSKVFKGHSIYIFTRTVAHSRPGVEGGKLLSGRSKEIKKEYIKYDSTNKYWYWDYSDDSCKMKIKFTKA